MSGEYKDYRAMKTIHVGEAGQLVKGEIIQVGRYDVLFGGQKFQRRSFLDAIDREWIVPLIEEPELVPVVPTVSRARLLEAAKIETLVRMPPGWGKLSHWRKKTAEIEKNIVDLEILRNIVKHEPLKAVIAAAKAKIALLEEEVVSTPAPVSEAPPEPEDSDEQES